MRMFLKEVKAIIPCLSPVRSFTFLYCSNWIYIQYIDHYHERIKGLSCKRCRVQQDRQTGTFNSRLSKLGQQGRALSQSGDGQIGFQYYLQQADANDLLQAGRWWNRMLYQTSKTGQRGKTGLSAILIIRVTERTFDDFAYQRHGWKTNHKLLGLD